MLCNHHRRRLCSLARYPGCARRRPLPSSNATMPPPIFRGRSTMSVLLPYVLFYALALVVEQHFHVHAFSPLLSGWKGLPSTRTGTTGQSKNTMLRTTRQPRLRLQNEEDNVDDNDTTSSGIPRGFNPLNYDAAVSSRGAGTSSSSTPYSSVQNVISLRQTRMQQVMAELLNAASVDATKADKINNEGKQQPTLLQTVLEENRDFLLEPLDDEDAVQDPNDSIYIGCASREERYHAFEQTMAERIQRARDPTAKRVLTALRDFVLACE